MKQYTIKVEKFCAEVNEGISEAELSREDSRYKYRLDRIDEINKRYGFSEKQIDTIKQILRL